MSDVTTDFQSTDILTYHPVVQPLPVGDSRLSPLLSSPSTLWRFAIGTFLVPVHQIPNVPWQPCQHGIWVTQWSPNLLLQGGPRNSYLSLDFLTSIFYQAICLMLSHWRFSRHTLDSCGIGCRGLKCHYRRFTVALHYHSLVAQRLQEVGKVLHSVRGRTLRIHKSCSHWRSSAVLHNQNGFCSTVFCTTLWHKRIVTGDDR